ncbi:phospholipase D family protein [Dokdonella soli]|uniref:PLD phosphodiesterase domain-containing protein n=1 Tax=Dokdonella soli TaxID=529810 RepID=A0ABP3TWQ6_9GAMM
MKVLTRAKEIRNALHELQPSRIAVAYVGSGWEQYVSAERLKEIVVSPTLGSNPYAIEEMMRKDKLGHENVYFLDNLHSKIYLGARAALVGSCNLSNNGMGDGGLFEMATLLTDQEIRTQLAMQIERYKAAARTLYPTRQKKLARLRELKEQCDKAQWFGFVSAGSKIPSVQQYESKLDRIHIVWCGSHVDEYSQAHIRSAVPAIREVGPDDYFSYTLQFLEEDDVRPHDWILCWRCNDDGSPRKGGDVSWFYVHHVVSNGFDTDDYPKLAGQASPKFLKCPAPPFTLDPSTKALIRSTLGSCGFPELLSFDDSLWRLGPADAVTHAFIDALKNANRAERNAR